MKLTLALLVVCACLSTPCAAQPSATQGVTRSDITVGTIQDLSGPLASYGRDVLNGMRLRVEEQNEQGGIHGRRVKLLHENSSYDPEKASLAAQKLVNQDQIFAMVGHIGTAHNNAALPIQLNRNVINFLPLSGAREMFDPPHRLKWAFLTPNFDQMRIATIRLMKDRNLRKACIIYQDDEYGLEILRGAEAGLKLLQLDLVEKASFKRGATDFSSQVAKLKAANCEFVAMGTLIRETVGAIVEARKTSFSPVFAATVGAYTDLIPKLGGRAMDGLFVTMAAQYPYLDESSHPIRFWATKYRTRFDMDPTGASVYGYYIMDAFSRAAHKAGSNLNTDSFVKSMEELVLPPDKFGMPEARFSPSRHLGSPFSRLSQLQDGRWRVISDYVAFNRIKVSYRPDGRVKVESEYFPE